MKLNLLLLLTVLPLSVAASPPRGGPDCDRSGPPHVQLLENADAIGIDDDTYLALVKLFEEMPAREEMEAATEAEREQLREDSHEVMDEALSMLTEEQLEAARELLPPPPGQRGPDSPDSRGSDSRGGPPQR